MFTRQLLNSFGGSGPGTV